MTGACIRKLAMRKARLIPASMALSACLACSLPSETRAAQQENLPPSSFQNDLSELQLPSAIRRDLEDALNRRDYKRAEAMLVEEAERDPKSTRTARLLNTAAGIFFLDGQFLNAAIAWKKAEAIAPLDERSRFTLAMTYIELQHRDWARPELEKLAAAHSGNALYLYWLARLDYDAQNYAAAMVRLQYVIELDPKMMRAYDTLGLCSDYLGKFEEAVKNYNRAIELNRRQSKPSPWPHVDLAISLISLNQLSEAEKNLREALGYDPQLPQAHYQLGRVLEMRGQYAAAVQSLSQAVALDPTYPEPHYLLGRIHHRLGEDALSRAEVARFQQLKKSSDTPPSPTSPSPRR